MSEQPLSDQRFPTWKQAFVMFGGGLVLAVSACFGCFFSLDFGGRNTAPQIVTITLAIIASGGLLATLVGVVLVLMRILRALFAKKDATGSTGNTGSTGSQS